MQNELLLGQSTYESKLAALEQNLKRLGMEEISLRERNQKMEEMLREAHKDKGAYGRFLVRHWKFTTIADYLSNRCAYFSIAFACLSFGIFIFYLTLNEPMWGVISLESIASATTVCFGGSIVSFLLFLIPQIFIFSGVGTKRQTVWSKSTYGDFKEMFGNSAVPHLVKFQTDELKRVMGSDFLEFRVHYFHKASRLFDPFLDVRVKSLGNKFKFGGGWVTIAQWD